MSQHYDKITEVYLTEFYNFHPIAQTTRITQVTWTVRVYLSMLAAMQSHSLDCRPHFTESPGYSRCFETQMFSNNNLFFTIMQPFPSGFV